MLLEGEWLQPPSPNRITSMTILEGITAYLAIGALCVVARLLEFAVIRARRRGRPVDVRLWRLAKLFFLWPIGYLGGSGD